jgi:hypothetical protein
MSDAEIMQKRAHEAAIDHGLWLAPDDDETNYQSYVAGFLEGARSERVLLADVGMKRAQIAALEEEDAHMVAYYGGTYTDENREWRQAKIAALRKELE